MAIAQSSYLAQPKLQQVRVACSGSQRDADQRVRLNQEFVHLANHQIRGSVVCSSRGVRILLLVEAEDWVKFWPHSTYARVDESCAGQVKVQEKQAGGKQEGQVPIVGLEL